MLALGQTSRIPTYGPLGLPISVLSTDAEYDTGFFFAQLRPAESATSE